MRYQDQLQATIDDLVRDGRGVLAVDESAPTIAKRFQAIGVESTEEHRRAYRSLLLTAPGLGEHISGIILFEETMTQRTEDGTLLPAVAWNQKIVPGIKVDKGKIPLALSPGDHITEGLDGLAQRLKTYRDQGPGSEFRKFSLVGDQPIPRLFDATAGAAILNHTPSLLQWPACPSATSNEPSLTAERDRAWPEPTQSTCCHVAPSPLCAAVGTARTELPSQRCRPSSRLRRMSES